MIPPPIMKNDVKCPKRRRLRPEASKLRDGESYRLLAPLKAGPLAFSCFPGEVKEKEKERKRGNICICLWHFIWRFKPRGPKHAYVFLLRYTTPPLNTSSYTHPMTVSEYIPSRVEKAMYVWKAQMHFNDRHCAVCLPARGLCVEA